MARVRTDVATLGAGWNATLEWYAKAIGVLEARAITDRTSWRYLGAIHGFDRGLWQQHNIVGPSAALPPTSEWNGRMWNQCQHQGWYFLPWHRGYLAAFEAIVAQVVVELGGPADWALPYWNYFDSNNPNARQIPDAFLFPALPDGSTNPLATPPRGAIALAPTDISLGAMQVFWFTSAPGAVGFGGGATVFAQFGGRAQTGELELDPHNSVHVVVGGPQGYMYFPELAALDPIFWLHHCNVDRLWAAWLNDPQNVQENRPDWRGGPSPRHFEMPDPFGAITNFTPGETLPGGRLAPTYDNLTIGTGAGAMPAAVAQPAGGAMPASLSSNAPPSTVLVGANAAAVTVNSAQVATTVPMTSGTTVTIAAAPVQERIYLNLENVRGAAPSGMLEVFVSSPATAPEHVKSVALFGLARASAGTGPHGGNGISVAIDITNVAKKLAQAAGVTPDRLDVHFRQPQADKPITVERVSIYRQRVG